MEEKAIWFIHVHRSNVKCRTQSKAPFSSWRILCIGERDMDAVGIDRGGVNGFPGSWMELKKPWWSWIKVLFSKMFDSWLSFSSVIRLYISWLGKYQSENEKQLCSSWPGTSGKLICQSCCSHFPMQPVPRWRFLSPNRPKSTILCWNTKENYNNLWITGYERDHLKSFG